MSEPATVTVKREMIEMVVEAVERMRTTHGCARSDPRCADCDDQRAALTELRALLDEEGKA